MDEREPTNGISAVDGLALSASAAPRHRTAHVPAPESGAQEEARWPTLDDVTKAAKAFLDPVLAGDLKAQWDPTAWS